MARVRLPIGNDFRYSTKSMPGRGVRHITSERSNLKEKLGVAVGAVFGPMDATSEEEAEEMIKKARRICEDYWALARVLAEECSSDPSSELDDCSDPMEPEEDSFDNQDWDL